MVRPSILRWRVGVVVALVVFPTLIPQAALTMTAIEESVQVQPAQEEFVPIDELPQEDRLPAAPFLIAAYSIIWVLAFGYMWLIGSRLAATEREIAELFRRTGQDTSQSL